MKSKSAAKPTRSYQQTSRAKSAKDNKRRILECFIKRLETEWFEEITLDALAADSGVTVQTILRRFGSKAGLLEAAHLHLGETVTVRRTIHPGDVERTTDSLTNDYEAAGDLVIRLLAQEDRHAVLKPMLDRGREGHREWLATVFSEPLSRLTPAKQVPILDALVTATDIYIWKLVRREMGRPVGAFKTIVKNQLQAVLQNLEPDSPKTNHRKPT